MTAEYTGSFDHWSQDPAHKKSANKLRQHGVDPQCIHFDVHDHTLALLEHWARDFRVEDYIDRFAQRITQAQRRYKRTASYHIRVMSSTDPKKPKEAHK